MRPYQILLMVCCLSSYACAQDYYIQSEPKHPFSFLVGTNWQYWPDRTPDEHNSTRLKWQLGLSYDVHLSKIFSIRPELAIRENYSGILVPSNNSGYLTRLDYAVLKGVSSQLALPLMAYFKGFAIGGGLFAELPLTMRNEVYSYTYVYDPNWRKDAEWEEKKHFVRGWQVNIETTFKRFQIRASLNKRSRPVHNGFPSFGTMIAVLSMGYRF